MNRIQILHITPHLGGGVGTVLLDWFKHEKNNKNFQHSVICLDYANEKAKITLEELEFQLKENMSKNENEILNDIKNSDIVLIHFWNHPLLYHLIVQNKLPKCRLILWSHISGINPPNVFTDKILNYPDTFIFTTPMSFKTKEIIEYDNKNSIISIWSTSNLSKYYNLEKEDDNSFFNVLYIGTVDNAKMYNNFVELCNKINIENIKFIVVGGPNNLELENYTKKLGISNKFIFAGKVEDIIPYLKISKIFGYPLTKGHFGTCDQSIQEAMTTGLVPVVFDNEMEKSMINNDCGFICKNEEEYIKAIEKLYYDKDLLKRMQENAKNYAIKEFSIEKMSEDWNKVFNEIMQIEKTYKKWNTDKINLKTIDIFFESLGEYKKIFELPINELKKELSKPNWTSNSKGTHLQYKSFLDDGSLDKFIF